MVNSVADAKAFAAAMKFPPLGERSWGPTRVLALHRHRPPLQTYLETANDDTLAIAMIETRAAYDALDDILAVDGIDGVFVGPSDFSHRAFERRQSRSERRRRCWRWRSDDAPTATKRAGKVPCTLAVHGRGGEARPRPRLPLHRPRQRPHLPRRRRERDRRTLPGAKPAEKPASFIPSPYESEGDAAARRPPASLAMPPLRRRGSGRRSGRRRRRRPSVPGSERASARERGRRRFRSRCGLRRGVAAGAVVGSAPGSAPSPALRSRPVPEAEPRPRAPYMNQPMISTAMISAPTMK